MNRKFGFHPEARDELRAAIRFYESERPGVGQAWSKKLAVPSSNFLNTHCLVHLIASTLGPKSSLGSPLS